MEKSLNDRLNFYAQGSPLRMHMPGHKGKGGFDADITEIDGFDNLHNPMGIIKEGMELAAKAWGSKRSFFLVNGSTCGILAAVRALTKRGDRAIVARNCHKSVYNALELCGVSGIYVMPQTVEEWNIFGSVTPHSVEKLLESNSGVGLVIITSPTYEGVISDIEEICRIAHERGARVLVDEAHGAHLGFDRYFEKSSVECGADIVVQSLHKTLFCPTQTAIMHINDETLESALRRQLSVFETSSPSYMFLAAADKLVRGLSQGGEIFAGWTNALKSFYIGAKQLCNIEVLAAAADNIDEIYAYDKSKIVVRCADNAKLEKKLRERYNTYLEAACPDFLTAMTGMGDSVETIGRFLEILTLLDSEAQRSCGAGRPFIYTIPTVYESAYSAAQREYQLTAADRAAGKLCGEYVWEYPPGIPLLIPGEIIPESFCEGIKKGIYTNISSDSGGLPEQILSCINIDEA